MVAKRDLQSRHIVYRICNPDKNFFKIIIRPKLSGQKLFRPVGTWFNFVSYFLPIYCPDGAVPIDYLRKQIAIGRIKSKPIMRSPVWDAIELRV